MSNKVIRCESHPLSCQPSVRLDMERTIIYYRRAVRMAATVALTHWPDLAQLRPKERQMALEALFHATKQRPCVKYPLLDRVFGKMPSYLRRAALHHALGAVSSFLSNYGNWLDDTERKRGSRPPRLGFSNVYPTLYGGNMLLPGAGLKTVQIKLLGANGQWRFTQPLALKGRLKRLPKRFDLSPSLIVEGTKARLSCPVELKRIVRKKISRVCSVDVGINTAATAAIVDSTGTVITRKFFTCGRHNDRRDKLTAQIAAKQAASGGGIGRRLGKGFCAILYRRMAGISLQAAREMAKCIVDFAMANNAKALVVENLKGWKPKGGSKQQRKRFHRFQHRMLVKYLAFKAEEFGLRLQEVFARGTSAFAYDGSGLVKRDKENYSLAKFASGKRYNADLNAAYNIAARGWEILLGLFVPKEQQADTGKSPGSVKRMPFVLADLWQYHAQSKVGRKQPSKGRQRTDRGAPDAPTTAPSGA